LVALISDCETWYIILGVYLSVLSPELISFVQNVKTFKDVKGCDDAKQELEEVVEYLKNPTKFTRLGGKLPKVCLGYIFPQILLL